MHLHYPQRINHAIVVILVFLFVSFMIYISQTILVRWAFNHDLFMASGKQFFAKAEQTMWLCAVRVCVIHCKSILDLKYRILRWNIDFIKMSKIWFIILKCYSRLSNSCSAYEIHQKKKKKPKRNKPVLSLHSAQSIALYLILIMLFFFLGPIISQFLAFVQISKNRYCAQNQTCSCSILGSYFKNR